MWLSLRYVCGPFSPTLPSPSGIVLKFRLERCGNESRKLPMKFIAIDFPATYKKFAFSNVFHWLHLQNARQSAVGRRKLWRNLNPLANLISPTWLLLPLCFPHKLVSHSAWFHAQSGDEFLQVAFEYLHWFSHTVRKQWKKPGLSYFIPLILNARGILMK